MRVFEVLEEYVHAKKSEIDAGKPVVVEVRDTDTFERLVVSAVIAPPERELAGSDRLVLRDLAENVAADGWKIRVLQEVDPESVEIHPESAFRKGGRGSS